MEIADSAIPILGGGLGIALCKEAVSSKIGADVRFETPTTSSVTLFAEGGARALYAVPQRKAFAFLQVWKGFPLSRIGTVGGDELRIPGIPPQSLKRLEETWRGD